MWSRSCTPHAARAIYLVSLPIVTYICTKMNFKKGHMWLHFKQLTGPACKWEPRIPSHHLNNCGEHQLASQGIANYVPLQEFFYFYIVCLHERWIPFKFRTTGWKDLLLTTLPKMSHRIICEYTTRAAVDSKCIYSQQNPRINTTLCTVSTGH